MIFKNLKMQSLLDQFQNTEIAKLSAPLQAIIDFGFFQIEDMFFFSQKSQNISTEFLGSLDIITQRYGDRSGFEKSMNSIHIENYESEDVVGQSLLFFYHLKQYWITHDSPDCTIFLSVQNSVEFGIMANVSLCISRLNENVMDVANIEDYENAVMVEFVKSCSGS